MQKYWPERRCHGKDNIWYAINRVNQENVILKFFPMKSCDDYKVSREAYTMKYLYNEDPKHFLQLYDYLEDNNEDQYMIAMERAECSLEDIVNERGHLSEEEAIPILREILYGIQVMHKNNFIHRDLKLSNILLAHKNDLSSIKIIDFGETVDRTDEYLVSGIVGTLHYMAPEILKKKKYGKPVDIWAFGVIAYRLLTGYFPFTVNGENHSKQLKAILARNVSYLNAENKRLSNKAIDFINCLLDPEPNSRMPIQTALDHPFLNPYFEGEFVPYKPIPKFSKNMSKENINSGKLNMKALFNKAMKKTKKQDIAGESEKIIKTLFSKSNKDNENENENENETEQNNVRFSEDTDFGSSNENEIQYSKTFSRPHNKNDNDDLRYSKTTYQGGRNNEIPEYLNVTLRRNNYQNNNQYNGNDQYNNQYNGNDQYNNQYNGNDQYNNQYNNQYNGNDQYNNQYNNQYNDQYNSPEIKYSKTYTPNKNRVNDGESRINHSQTYAPNSNPRNNNNNRPYENKNQGNFSDDYIPPNIKSAGNSIDAYPTIQLSKAEVRNNIRTNEVYMPPEQNENNPNGLYPKKLPKTAGNTIYTYDEFEDVVNNNSSSRHNRAYSDSTRQVNHTDEYYQNSSPRDRDRDRDRQRDREGRDRNQYDGRYGNELGKSNTVTGASSRSNQRRNNCPSPLSESSRPIENSNTRREREPERRHHRKTSSSGSNPRYDYDSEGQQNHHRKTSSSGSSKLRPDYYDGRHHQRSSSGNSSKIALQKQGSEPSRLSPRIDSPVLRMSPLNDNGNYSSRKDSPNKDENHDVKLTINVPMKTPKIITIDSNHPKRNSSLLKKM